MTQALSLRLKPICIEFYQQTDCEIDSQFLAQIEHRGTVYKSGILKSSKSQFLSLSNIMWTEFLINQSDFNSNINICLSALGDSTVRLWDDFGKQKYGGNLGWKEFTSFLPIDELLCVPVNKKKKFCFPILREGQIQGEAEFKMVIKQKAVAEDENCFQGLALKERDRLKNGYNAAQVETAKSVTGQKKVIKPVLSQTSIEITPDLFVKKLPLSSPEFETISDSTDLNNMDLLSKFEFLNKKFQSFDLGQQIGMNHEQLSVWEEEEEDPSRESIRSEKKIKQNEYDIIEEQTEEYEGSDRDFNQIDI